MTANRTQKCIKNVLLENNYPERFVKDLVDKVQQQNADKDWSREANRVSSQPTEMLTIRRGDQEEKNLTQGIADVFM